jgi:hypothetical protein
MHSVSKKPRALFIFKDGSLLREDEVCSGEFPSSLEGKPCPFSDEGRMPDFVSPDEQIAISNPELRSMEEFIPACTLQRLGTLGSWPGVLQERVPERYQALSLYKCRQMFLFLILP